MLKYIPTCVKMAIMNEVLSIHVKIEKSEDIALIIHQAIYVTKLLGNKNQVLIF